MIIYNNKNNNINLNLNDDPNNTSQCIINKNSLFPIDINIEHLDSTDTKTIINNQTLTFATNNVHGLNNSVKNNQIIDTFIQQQIDFVGLTETHHKQYQELQCKEQSFYDTFWSNNFNKFTGVGLLINKQWSKYIHRIYKSNERYIYADLYLAGHIKLRVIVTYIHANMSEKEERINLQNEIIDIIKNSNYKKYYTIIMGDFNTNIDRYNNKINNNAKINWKYNLIHNLFQNNYVDLYEISNDDTTPTWIGPNNNSSRIDAIFSSHNFISDFLYCGLQSPILYQSDHRIVTAYFANIEQPKEHLSRKWKNKKLTPIFAQITTQGWDSFTKKTCQIYKEKQLEKLLNLSPTMSHINHI